MAEIKDSASSASSVASSRIENSSDDSSSLSAVDETPAAVPPEKAPNSAGPPKTRSGSSGSKREAYGSVRKLSASQIQALAASPESLPVAVFPSEPVRKANGAAYPTSAGAVFESMADQLNKGLHHNNHPTPTPAARPPSSADLPPVRNHALSDATTTQSKRPATAARTVSTPPTNRRPSGSWNATAPPYHIRRNSLNPSAPRPPPPPLNIGAAGNFNNNHPGDAATPSAKKSSSSTRPDKRTPVDEDFPMLEPEPPASIQPTIPLPPMSLHTHLQLELAGVRPSPLYIYRHQSSDIPYESSAVKFERLLNALLLPHSLETVMTFGTFACLDAFLYTFTLLPLRFVIAAGVLVQWWAYVVSKEVKWLVGFVWSGLWRLWQRSRRGRSSSRQPTGSDIDRSRASSAAGRSQSRAREAGPASDTPAPAAGESMRLNGNAGLRPPAHALPLRGNSTRAPASFRHRRTKSMPSNLTPYHKADLLQGAVIICSSLALMTIDASRMYHFIRAQSAVKLYVIYNLLEVGDRLLAAIGQDILECLFSSETLSRNSFGRSKILLPLGMFVLSLVYNVAHAICLFYQVITLNVAVNSYSNALLSLLMSNQFVEIKGSVFKKIEKENLFQLTCSDVVERFQLWIILAIIGMRNIVEVGGLSVPGAGTEAEAGMSGPGPIHTASSLPASFTLIPSWLFSGEVLSPFLIVIGIEMLVDWIKHAYINKFNNVKPSIYHRMLDIFCKDYYTNAFGAPALTRRIGLPLLPLSCLFIRASVQTYHMFLATHLPPPMPTSTTELSVESSLPSSPAVIAALDRLDSLIRNALGRAVYGTPYASSESRPFWSFTSDDAIALLTMATVFFLAWLLLLVVKLLLGMVLLKYARGRYAAIRRQEQAIATGQGKRESFYQPGKRVGGWGQVEVGDERRKLLYADDPDGLKRMRERERKGDQMAKKMEIGDDGLEKVTRYEMIAKRIW
ncbi:eukaryotic membrane protein family-domain-containing protein [Xylariales sp. PMI_506]|nr:eukaryotic membrane protein family-domain-containing protein [Xylariales sp. PMI_506]